MRYFSTIIYNNIILWTHSYYIYLSTTFCRSPLYDIEDHSNEFPYIPNHYHNHNNKHDLENNVDNADDTDDAGTE